MKLLVILLLVLTAAGCSYEHRPPLLVEEVDGCKVYRVDAGAGYGYIWTTVCQGATDWDERHGKTTEHIHVETRRKEAK